MQGNTILKSYAVWLRNQGIKSVYIFTSGISKVNEEFFMPVRHKDMFEILPDAIRRQEAVAWLTSLESFINLAFEKTVVRQDKDEFGNGIGPIREVLDFTEKKKLENRRNCLRKFTEFVAFLQEILSQAEIQREGIDIDESKSFIQKENLYRLPIYSESLGPDQDIFYLPSLLVRLFHFYSLEKNAEILEKAKVYWGDNTPMTPDQRLKEWKKFTLSRARFYTHGKSFLYKDISGISIDKEAKRVFIVYRGQRFEAVRMKSLEPILCRMRLTLMIKSKTDINEILSKHKYSFPAMRQLTEMIKQIVRDVELEVPILKMPFSIKMITIRLDEFNKNDYHNLIPYVFKSLPKEKLAALLPHLLQELYQLTLYTTPVFDSIKTDD